jgi:hypothetical protein
MRAGHSLWIKLSQRLSVFPNLAATTGSKKNRRNHNIILLRSITTVHFSPDSEVSILDLCHHHHDTCEWTHFTLLTSSHSKRYTHHDEACKIFDMQSLEEGDESRIVLVLFLLFLKLFLHLEGSSGSKSKTTTLVESQAPSILYSKTNLARTYGIFRKTSTQIKI